MDNLMGIIMDGKTYHLRIVADSFVESFRVADGPAAGQMRDGSEVRDVVGTYYDYRMDIEPDPQYMQDYKAFWTAISAPVEGHVITMPGPNGPITHRAMVSDGGHTMGDYVAGERAYKNLTVFFKALAPDRYPGGA